MKEDRNTIFEKTVEAFKVAFSSYNIEDIWENVIAFVVRPGVEFGDAVIYEYNRTRAESLTNVLAAHHPDIGFEGHSTDYQTPVKLREMVQDGNAILKVGPALTFALREGIFTLECMEKELYRENKNETENNYFDKKSETGESDISLSNFKMTLDKAMIENPVSWQKHYSGSHEHIIFSGKYSFSDRCRYYLPMPSVNSSLERLFKNLKIKDVLPLTLLSRFLPVQYRKIREGKLKPCPESILCDKVKGVLEDYYFAITGGKENAQKEILE